MLQTKVNTLLSTFKINSDILRSHATNRRRQLAWQHTLVTWRLYMNCLTYLQFTSAFCCNTLTWYTPRDAYRSRTLLNILQFNDLITSYPCIDVRHPTGSGHVTFTSTDRQPTSTASHRSLRFLHRYSLPDGQCVSRAHHRSTCTTLKRPIRIM
jgi:hypothetical protein